jgi:hypothetical protein
MGRNLLNIWVKRYRKNGKVHEVGRPTIIGSPIMRELKGMLTDEMHNILTSDFVENLQDLHKKRMVETTKVAACSIKPTSRRSVGLLV